MTVGIVGLGMIGGSIGLALREPGREIIGYDPSETNARVAMERFCADRVTDMIDVASADVVFVAVPPQSAVEVLEQLKIAKRPDTVVTDCTSVKAEIVGWADREGAGWFVGGHPMAGHEKSGPTYASSWMFRGARWILTPTKGTDRNALGTVETLVKAMGATPVRTKADNHDREIAILSHLPHAFAAVLVTLGADVSRPDIAGGSWRDLTRVGGVDPNLWTQIMMGNRAELSRILAQAEGQLEELRRALDQKDSEAVFGLLKRAQTAKLKQNS